jgi:anaerobic selenocysteine-containing dehydrogenase
MVDAILDHPATGHATVAALRAGGGIGELRISHVANPTLEFDTPSRTIEFYSEDAKRLGLPPLPEWQAPRAPDGFPLALTQGRTLTHFHGFYNNGQELPTLARREREPLV